MKTLRQHVARTTERGAALPPRTRDTRLIVGINTVVSQQLISGKPDTTAPPAAATQEGRHARDALGLKHDAVRGEFTLGQGADVAGDCRTRLVVCQVTVR
jgi:hypothetical protein